MSGPSWLWLAAMLTGQAAIILQMINNWARSAGRGGLGWWATISALAVPVSLGGTVISWALGFPALGVAAWLGMSLGLTPVAATSLVTNRTCLPRAVVAARLRHGRRR